MTEPIVIKSCTNIKLLYGISLTEYVDITDVLTEFLKTSYKILKTDNFHKIVLDPYVCQTKKLYMLVNDVLTNTLEEEGEKLDTDIYYYPEFSIRYGINEIDNVVVTDKIMEYLSKNKITTKTKINDIFDDCYKDRYKRLYIFEYDTIVNTVDEFHNYLTKNIQLIDHKIVITNEFIYELYIRELNHYCSYNEALLNYNELKTYIDKIEQLNKLHIINKIYFYEIFNFINDYPDIFENCSIEQVYKRILINPKIEYRYFCYRYMNYIRKLYVKPIFLNKECETVLIWKSKYPHIEFILRNTINKLPDWSHTIVCNIDNYELVRNVSRNISDNIKIVVINDIDMKLDKFWKNFKGNTILIYNEESCITENNISDFTEYSFISSSIENINEEILSLYVKNKTDVPSNEICKKFSETIGNFNRPWLNKKDWKQMLYNYVVIQSEETDLLNNNINNNNNSIYDTYIYDLYINNIIIKKNE